MLLVIIFFFSQLIGLLVVSKYVDYSATTEQDIESGDITWHQLPYSLERPKVEESSSYLFIIGMIAFGTVLLLLLIKFKIYRLWKLWYFVGTMLCLSVALSAFIGQSSAFVIALVLSYLKIFRPNVLIHNLTELFIYGGLAAIFVPIINLFSIFILLILISAYDFWAVYKSKHMVKIAEFQTNSKIFAGLLVPYSSQNIIPKPGKKQTLSKNAILGGGDIGFPLLFAGVIMKNYGLMKAFLIPVAATLGLLLLLTYAKKDKFYPAMPFLTAACFIGYVAVLVLS